MSDLTANYVNDKIKITENGHLVARYTYDGLNRLIREDNKPLNKTVIYTYDTAGNIIDKCKYEYTEYTVVPHAETSGDHFCYEYEGDKLTHYNNEWCEYNNLGNPKTYRDKACVWQYGNRLTKYGSTTFAYDSLGRRTKKGSTTYTYDSDGRLIKQSDGLEFFYDASGVAMIKYNNELYFYRKDAQGNIIAILNIMGHIIAKYVYDAWGNNAVLDKDGNDISDDEEHIGNINPFRYRGYYYDTETELYFLQTRYYDPEVGRFISQDSVEYADPEAINGLNLYAYCLNNPVMHIDPTGCSWSSFWSGAGRFFGGVALAAIGFSTSLVTVIPALFSPAATVICEFGLTLGFYGAGLVGSVFDSAIYSDMQKIGWNPYNTNAVAAAECQKMSFYKGVPVLRADMDKGRSMSFGIIFLDRSVSDPDTVRHEFGHVPQLMLLGIARYGLCIGIPSWKEWYKRTPWTYYESPWEAGADYFGGVTSRPITNVSRDRALKYLLLSYFLGPIVHSFYNKL